MISYDEYRCKLSRTYMLRSIMEIKQWKPVSIEVGNGERTTAGAQHDFAMDPLATTTVELESSCLLSTGFPDIDLPEMASRLSTTMLAKGIVRE